MPHGQPVATVVQRQPQLVPDALKLRIGLADEFHCKPRQPVNGKEHAREQPVPLQRAKTEGQRDQDGAQQQALQRRFIKLRGMARAGFHQRDAALRGLFREKDFRVALNHALDRDAIGQSIARGPFTYPFPGGFSAGSPYYDKASTVYYPYDAAKAGQMFDALGLADTDGNGTRNLPNGGADVEIDMLYANDRTEDRKQIDAVTSMLAEVGIRVLPKPVEDIDIIAKGGGYNTLLRRQQWVVPTREFCLQIPVDATCPDYHMAEEDGSRELFDFEQDILDAFQTINTTWEAADAAEAAKVIQKAWTENAYTIGTIQAPAALLVNKRVKNAHPGTPVFMFEWAEDGVMRERLWSPASEQLDELLAGTIAEY